MRKARHPFSDEECAIAQSFCDQAMIAIKNVSMFQEAQATHAAAKQADEAKSAFLATMRHEIRTPMNAVIGGGGLLIDKKWTPNKAALPAPPATVTMRSWGSSMK